MSPTPLGWAIVISGGLVIYTGWTSGERTLAGTIALVVMLVADAVISYLDLRSCSLAVRPVRTGGTPESPPTVRVTSSSDRSTVQFQLHSLYPGLFTYDPVAVGPQESQVLSWEGTHPIAVNQISWRLTTSRLGLCAVSRSHFKAIRVPVYRGPALPDEPVKLPSVDSMEEVSILREYVPGDRISRINWAATARTTTLFVRDSGGQNEEIVMSLFLGPGYETREDNFEATRLALTTARSLGEQILAQGRPLRFVSVESREARDELAQAQARSIRPELPVPKPASIGSVVQGPVTDQSELLLRLAKAQASANQLELMGPHIRVTLDGVEVCR